MVDLVASTLPSLDGLGAFYFLCKPVQPKDILSAVWRRMR
jgi:hypothetical protein